MKPKVILFDCWNTLFFSTVGSSLQIFASRLAHHDISYDIVKKFEEAYMLEPHEDMTEPTKKFLQSLHVPATPQMVRWAEAKVLSSVPRQQPYDDTLEALKELRGRGYRLGMITNSWKGAIERLREKYNLDSEFETITASCDHGIIKPHPEIFLKTCRTMKVDPKDALMVGDNLKDDKEAAAKAGLQSVLLDRNNIHPTVDGRVQNLHELLDLLA